MPTAPAPAATNDASSSSSGTSAAAVTAAVGLLRMWLCATLQPVMASRPRALMAFLSSGGVPIICRQLAAGPSDTALHACGVLAAALRHDKNSRKTGSGGMDKQPAVEAVDVRVCASVCGFDTFMCVVFCVSHWCF